VLLMGKAMLIYGLAKLAGQDNLSASRTALVLAQGGEFALVLFGFALGEGILPVALSSQLSMIVILSMVATPLLFALHESWITPRFNRREAPTYDSIDDESPAVRSSAAYCACAACRSPRSTIAPNKWTSSDGSEAMSISATRPAPIFCARPVPTRRG
jgi:hypothetical protein